jgi:ABC-type transport system involved in cytochrome c biogenesis permease subunit
MIRSSPESYSSSALIMGLVFGVISIIIFVIFLFIGIFQKQNSKKIFWPWGIGLIIYLSIFILGILDYLTYLRSDSLSTFFGFPTPTAWMLFGIYLFPFYFTLFYIIKFKYWILSPESERKFKELIK